MPPMFESSQARTSSRLAAVALISAGLAGCSGDIGRFQDNPFSSTAARGNVPPTEVTGTVPQQTYGAPVGRVESQPLPGSPSASLPPPPPSYRSSTGASAPMAPPRSAAAPAPAPQRSASGTHTVMAGQSLISIAKLYGKSRGDIARANSIKPDAHVRIGQRLTIPGMAPERIKTAAVAGKPIVRGAPPAPLAVPQQAKPIAAGKPVAAAKPIAQQPAKPVQQAALPAPAPAPGQKPAPQKLAEVKETARISAPAADAAAEAKDAQPSATGAIPTFRWPVRGRVIAGFGPKPNGQQNDGINLAVPEGTSVKAAEDGVVAYAGNELKGYGNLVLVRHSNGYVTAYAHASELMVKKGDSIKRGQIIAKAGQTGSVNAPQLHFEIRKGSTPVDPTQYLSGT